MIETFETHNFKNVKHCETGEQLQKKKEKYKIHSKTLNFNLDLANMESVLIEYLWWQWLH